MNLALSKLQKALVDRYSIERELGAGAAAVVYLAHDVRHNRKVALKVLRPELSAALGTERFLSEIRITASLNHPNVVPLYDSGEVAGFLFYVMPAIEGETLRQKLEREKQLAVDDALAITRGLADALSHAHAHGIVHRDIKPENILLHHGVPLLADFGIARALEQAGGERLATTGISLGTPKYMSPEQAMGNPAGPVSDIYGLATVLYEMLAGDPPFAGTNVQAIIARVIREKPMGLRLIRDTVPPALEAAVVRALAKVPADRFASVSDFAAALSVSTVQRDSGAHDASVPPVRPGHSPAHLFAELKRRRVFRTAIGYAGIAFVVLQAAPPLFAALKIPDWVMTLIIILLILSFPVVLLLSWIFEWSPEGDLRLERPAHGPPAAQLRGWSRRRVLGAALALLATVLVALAARGWFTLAGRSDLAQNRVMVFPLIVPTDFSGPRSVGEDVAAMIGNVLDGTGTLRWVDGWALLRSEQRENPRELLLAEAREMARAKQCAYFLTGRLVARGDSADVFLSLHDVRGDSVIANGSARGSLADVWRPGLRAVNDILPQLIAGPAVDITREWKDREPAAVASFLLGEAEFRRVRMGEALAHYRAAVAADSSFGLAAIRGAQAATWNHRPSEAASLIQVALRQPMPARYTNLARGYDAYLAGNADSASAAFQRAVAEEPDLAVAWAQLGEAYMHLLPERANPDSLAEEAFEAAHRLDPTATSLLFHLIEIRLRRGDTQSAAPLVKQFLAARPDSNLAGQIEIMDACVRAQGSYRWRDNAVRRPFPALAAAFALAAGGSQIGCAERGFATLLDVDTSGTNEASGRRWSALVGLSTALLAQGRADEAGAQIDKYVARWNSGASIYLLMAPFVPQFRERARAVAESDAQRYGANYASLSFSTRLWDLGVWEAHNGRAELAGQIAAELGKRALQSKQRRDDFLARSVDAYSLLARGDSTRALQNFAALIDVAVPADALRWDEADPLGGERLTYARLLYSRGEAQKAIDVASVFDSAWPTTYLLYLPMSLELRAAAAGALGDRTLQSHYRARLARLQPGRAVQLQ